MGGYGGGEGFGGDGFGGGGPVQPRLRRTAPGEAPGVVCGKHQNVVKHPDQLTAAGVAAFSWVCA